MEEEASERDSVVYHPWNPDEIWRLTGSIISAVEEELFDEEEE